MLLVFIIKVMVDPLKIFWVLTNSTYLGNTHNGYIILMLEKKLFSFLSATSHIHTLYEMSTAIPLCLLWINFINIEDY